MPYPSIKIKHKKATTFPPFQNKIHCQHQNPLNINKSDIFYIKKKTLTNPFDINQDKHCRPRRVCSSHCRRELDRGTPRDLVVSPPSSTMRSGPPWCIGRRRVSSSATVWDRVSLVCGNNNGFGMELGCCWENWFGRNQIQTQTLLVPTTPIPQQQLFLLLVRHSQTPLLKESRSGVVWSPTAMLRCGGVIDGDSGWRRRRREDDEGMVVVQGKGIGGERKNRERGLCRGLKREKGGRF